jgi:hypothetical protein
MRAPAATGVDLESCVKRQPKTDTLFLRIRGHRLIELVLLSILALVGCSGGSEDSADALRSRLDKLRSVPYSTVTDEAASGDTVGVIVYDRARACPGYNLYVSWTEPEASLIAMDGTVVHKWFDKEERPGSWHHAIVLDDGGLALIVRYREVRLLDWGSDTIWKTRVAAHHEITMGRDSTFYVAARELKQYRGLNVRFAAIVRISPDGRIISRWSTYDYLEEIKRKFDQEAFLDTILDSLETREMSAAQLDSFEMRVEVKQEMGKDIYDYFHLNTISIVPVTPLAGTDPRFDPGNLLICFRNVNQIAILDEQTMDILWVWGQGELQWPHHPTMLHNGNILVYDNGVDRGYSRILELDPRSESIVWEYVADPPGDFYSRFKGSCQRLPNGNTLICESERGRCFEVTLDGDIVWEWINPAVKKGQRVQVYRMMRYYPEQIEPLLGG